MSGVAPSRGRGLKHRFVDNADVIQEVAPSRGRGLKRARAGTSVGARGRPFTGAWIETIPGLLKSRVSLSPLHGGVD